MIYFDTFYNKLVYTSYDKGDSEQLACYIIYNNRHSSIDTIKEKIKYTFKNHDLGIYLYWKGEYVRLYLKYKHVSLKDIDNLNEFIEINRYLFIDKEQVVAKLRRRPKKVKRYKEPIQLSLF